MTQFSLLLPIATRYKYLLSLVHKRTLITGNNNNNNNNEDIEDDTSMTSASTDSSRDDCDPNNGRELDRSALVADNFSGNKEGLKAYFEVKESSIKATLESDIAETIGTEFYTPEYINELRSNAAALLSELEDSKDTILDLANIPLTEPSSPATEPSSPATEPSSPAAGPSSSNYFPQDTSDVHRTDFMTAPDEEDN